MATNPFKKGGDAAKFFDSLTESAQEKLLKNNYAVMTLDTILPLAGGYDAAMKDPLSFINSRPGKGAYNPGSYDDYIAAHPPMSFLDSLKGTLKVAAPFILPGLPGLGTAIGTSIGLTGTAATVVGNAVINTTINGGDIVKGVVSAAIPVLGQEVAGTIASSLVDSGMDKVLANSAGKIISSAGAAAVQGKDPLSALVAGGLSEGIPAITKDIPGFSDLPDFAKKSVNAAITAELSGRDPTQAAINSAISAGTKAMTSYANAGASSPTEAPLSEEEQEQLIENRLNKAIARTQISPEEEDANTQTAIKDIERIYGPSSTTTPTEETPATTRSLDGADVVKTLEDAGLTSKEADAQILPAQEEPLAQEIVNPVTVEQDPNVDDFIDQLEPYKNLSPEELVVVGFDEFGPVYGPASSVVDVAKEARAEEAARVAEGLGYYNQYGNFVSFVEGQTGVAPKLNPYDVGNLTQDSGGPESGVINYEGGEGGNEGGDIGEDRLAELVEEARVAEEARLAEEARARDDTMSDDEINDFLDELLADGAGGSTVDSGLTNDEILQLINADFLVGSEPEIIIKPETVDTTGLDEGPIIPTEDTTGLDEGPIIPVEAIPEIIIKPETVDTTGLDEGPIIPTNEEDVPGIEIVGDRDKTREHVFDPTFGGTLPLDDLPYLPTDDDFVPTDEIEEPETPVTTPGGSKPAAPGVKPGTVTKPSTNTTTGTTTGTKTAVAPTINTQQTSNADLLNLLGSKPELANIKSYKELFGEELFGDSYVPPSAGGAQPEDFANYGRGDEPSTASQDEGEDQFFRGGHVDDLDVNALLQILRS